MIQDQLLLLDGLRAGDEAAFAALVRSTAKMLTSPLPAFVTSRRVPSPLSTTELCEVRCGIPSPAPLVAYEPSSDNEPSGSRPNAITRLASVSFVWTKTAGCFESCIVPPIVGGCEHCLRTGAIRYTG